MIDPSAGLRAGSVDVGFVRSPFTDDGVMETVLTDQISEMTASHSTRRSVLGHDPGGIGGSAVDCCLANGLGNCFVHGAVEDVGYEF